MGSWIRVGEAADIAFLVVHQLDDTVRERQQAQCPTVSTTEQLSRDREQVFYAKQESAMSSGPLAIP